MEALENTGSVFPPRWGHRLSPCQCPAGAFPGGSVPLSPPGWGWGCAERAWRWGDGGGAKGEGLRSIKGCPVVCLQAMSVAGERQREEARGEERGPRGAQRAPKGRGAQGSGQRVPNGLESCREWEKAFTGLCKTAEEPPLSLHCPKPGAWHESSRRHRHLPAAGMHQRLPHNRTPVLCWQQHGKHPG